jgi:Rho-binding antiterminator
MKTETLNNCDLQDLLEALCVRRERVQLVYQDDNRSEIEINAYVEDIYAQGGADYLRLDTQQILCIDQLISVNGIKRSV